MELFLCSLPMSRDGSVDAIMYYWTMESFSLSHRYAALPFKSRLSVQEGDVVSVQDQLFLIEINRGMKNLPL